MENTGVYVTIGIFIVGVLWNASSIKQRFENHESFDNHRFNEMSKHLETIGKDVKELLQK